MAEFKRFFKIEIENEDGSIVYRNYATTVEGITTPADMGIAESSMNLSEVLCSGDLCFGEYNSNKFEVQLFGLSDGAVGPMPDVTGFTITVTDWGTADSAQLKNPIFVGLIDSATTDDKNGYRNIVAYDFMYKYKDLDVGKDWELFWTENEGEHKTRTLKEIREGVCDFVGIQTTSYERIPDSTLSVPITFNSDDAYTRWVSSGAESVEIVPEYVEWEEIDATGTQYSSVGIVEDGVYTASLTAINSNIYRFRDDSTLMFLVVTLQINDPEISDLVVGEKYRITLRNKEVVSIEGISTKSATNVIKLDSGIVYTYLKTNKKVGDYKLTFYHKGPESTIAFEDIANPNNVTPFLVDQSDDYVRYEFTYNQLNQEKLVFISNGLSYFKNISVNRCFPNDSKVFCYKDYQPGEMLAPNTSSITFSTLLSAICELQCVCPTMDRQGQLDFISLSNEVTHIDCTDSYAKNDTTFEDYTVLNPTGFDVYANSNMHMFKYPDTDDNSNPYIISGNIFLVTVTEDQARELLEDMRPSLLGISYTPANISMIVSDLSANIGDNVQITTYRENVAINNNHCVMSQTLSGPQLVDQLIECKASGPNQSTIVPSKNDSVVQGLTAKEYNTKVDNLETKVRTMVTKDSVEIEISKAVKEINEAGAEKVVTKGKNYVFDDSGINIADKTSEISTVVSHDGMEVSKENGYGDKQSMLKANNQGVDAQNLHATTYLIIGNRSRMEKYKEDRIGCFMTN